MYVIALVFCNSGVSQGVVTTRRRRKLRFMVGVRALRVVSKPTASRLAIPDPVGVSMEGCADDGKYSGHTDMSPTVLSTSESHGVHCLDGSPPAFYFRPGKGRGKRSFMVYFKGVSESGTFQPALQSSGVATCISVPSVHSFSADKGASALMQ